MAKAKRKENTAMLFDPKKLKQQLLQKQKEEEARQRGEIVGANNDVEAQQNDKQQVQNGS